MLCVEDAIDGCAGRESIGGLPRSFAAPRTTPLRSPPGSSGQVDRLPRRLARFRSCTSVCLAFTDAPSPPCRARRKADFVKKFAGLLAKDGVASTNRRPS